MRQGVPRSGPPSASNANGEPYEGANAAVDEAAAREGVRAPAAFPPQQVETYLNTLWLQDPDRWQSLEAVSLG